MKTLFIASLLIASSTAAKEIPQTGAFPGLKKNDQNKPHADKNMNEYKNAVHSWLL